MEKNPAVTFDKAPFFAGRRRQESGLRGIPAVLCEHSSRFVVDAGENNVLFCLKGLQSFTSGLDVSEGEGSCTVFSNHIRRCGEVVGTGVKESDAIIDCEYNRGEEQSDAACDHDNALQLPANG